MIKFPKYRSFNPYYHHYLHDVYISEPSEIIVKNEAAEIRNLKDTATIDDKSVVISICGTKPDFPSDRAAWATFFARGSRLNDGGVVHSERSQCSMTALLTAALQGLDRVDEECFNGSDSIQNIYLMTTSQELVAQIRRAYKWSGDGLKTPCPIEKPHHWRMILLLHIHIEALERIGKRVMFWVVEKEHIVDAERLALKSKKQHKAQESADKKADGACMKHWENKARQIPAAQELARCLGLKFPSSKKNDSANELFKTWLYPIRRLVISGADKPDNFVLLFGPYWDHPRHGITTSWKEIRVQFLSVPASGSKWHNIGEVLDAGATRWSPRVPNSEEEEELAKLKRFEKLAAARAEDRALEHGLKNLEITP